MTLRSEVEPKQWLNDSINVEQNRKCFGSFSALYDKPMTIVNDDSRVINKLDASLTEDARVVIYDCNMFIVQATGGFRLIILQSFCLNFNGTARFEKCNSCLNTKIYSYSETLVVKVLIHI